LSAREEYGRRAWRGGIHKKLTAPISAIKSVNGRSTRVHNFIFPETGCLDEAKPERIYLSFTDDDEAVNRGTTAGESRFEVALETFGDICFLINFGRLRFTRRGFNSAAPRSSGLVS